MSEDGKSRWLRNSLVDVAPPQELIIQMLVYFERSFCRPPLDGMHLGWRAYATLDEQLGWSRWSNLAAARGIPFEPHVIGPSGRIQVRLNASLEPDDVELRDPLVQEPKA